MLIQDVRVEMMKLREAPLMLFLSQPMCPHGGGDAKFIRKGRWHWQKAAPYVAISISTSQSHSVTYLAQDSL